MDEQHHSHQYIEHIQRIREHVRILNHSSERMTEEISDLSERVAAIEAHMSWLMRLIWMVLGGIAMLVFKVYGG
jgi:hypothetical protein